MTKIGLSSIETKVYLNEIQSEKFQNLDADNQMSLSFGLNEPLSCPKIALFCGVMGVYFVSFFLEHPV